MGLQHVLHDRHRLGELAVARGPADDHQAGIVAQLLLEAAHPVLDRGHGGMIDDQHLAAPAQVTGQRLRREAPSLDVVAGDVRDHLPAAGGDVGGEDRDPGPLGGSEVGDDGRRVAGSGHDRRDVLGDEVLDLRRLLGRIHLAGGDDERQPAGRRLLAESPLELLVEVVAGGEQRDAHQRLAAGRRAAARSAATGEAAVAGEDEQSDQGGRPPSSEYLTSSPRHAASSAAAWPKVYLRRRAARPYCIPTGDVRCSCGKPIGGIP